MKVVIILEMPNSEEKNFAKEYSKLKRKLSADGIAVLQRDDKTFRIRHDKKTKMSLL